MIKQMNVVTRDVDLHYSCKAICLLTKTRLVGVEYMLRTECIQVVLNFSNNLIK